MRQMKWTLRDVARLENLRSQTNAAILYLYMERIRIATELGLKARSSQSFIVDEPKPTTEICMFAAFNNVFTLKRTLSANRIDNCGDALAAADMQAKSLSPHRGRPPCLAVALPTVI